MIKRIIIASLVVTLACSLILGFSKAPQYIPPNGFVPDKQTAIKIAEAIWTPIYGEAINNEKPFNVTLVNGIWVVTGTFNGHGYGGVAYIEIQKSDCKILKVIHGK